ncbi:MAG: type II toxin-antitoxin system VapC family toxin [Candidatus Solibacter usitatus]|nr:type II toxin-antitoxin system VapC family toxin [Candidatus Solibacter usitatus]
MLVVDASVAVKWFIAEEGSEDADALLDSDIPLLAPKIIEVEVTSALAYRYRVGDLDAAEVRRAVARWVDGCLAAHAPLTSDDRELLKDAAELSIELDYKIPDCLYLALARSAGCPLITADAHLLRKTKGISGVRTIRLGDPLPGSK